MMAELKRMYVLDHINPKESLPVKPDREGEALT
jgi:hypothetical protein